MNSDFLCEKKLQEINPYYHELFVNATFVMDRVLDSYTAYFPYYTDHSTLHSLQVIDFCNKLIGDQIDKLNADEIFILLMSCYLHDSGMGISEKLYNASRDEIIDKFYLRSHKKAPIQSYIRDYHHEFSTVFIKNYAELFEIPSPEHLYAIIQVSRGHRKVNLYDDTEFSPNYMLPNGNTVCLPYLASLIRLADELDIARDRNPECVYAEHWDNMEYRKHYAVKSLEITDDAFILHLEKGDEEAISALETSVSKLQNVIDLCRDVTASSSKFIIRQKVVKLDYDDYYE